ncbi:ABC transporter permease [Brevundimonas aveniformis]|uniref:ABC transporter permease n=1 Tax=Brevundimonas aveniformis TaxID=370977 RepID=UPI0024903C83|nr:ABC transporter permease [Brevundimonas aveniformis]
MPNTSAASAEKYKYDLENRTEGNPVMGGLISDFSAVWKDWRVWFLLANQDVELRYRRSLLGPFWISLAMFSLILGIALLYSQIFEQPFRDYVIFIGTGLLVWTLISGLLTDGSQAVIEVERYLRATRIPTTVLAARNAYRSSLILIHNALPILVLILWIRHGLPLTSLLAIPGVMIILVFGFGATMVLAPLSARFRDLPQLIASVMQLMFFITPLFWRPSQLATDHPVVQFNPLHHLVEIVRQPLEGHLPTPTNYLVAIGVAVAALLLGAATIQASRKKMFFWL